MSIAVVTYNSADEISCFLKSVIANTEKIEYKITVIDNCSQDNTVELVKREFPDVDIIVTDENRGFGAGHNKMLGVNSKYHAILNPDITLNGDTLSGLVDYLEKNPEVALVTPKILNPDGTQQYLPKRKPTARYAFRQTFPLHQGVCARKSRIYKKQRKHNRAHRN